MFSRNRGMGIILAILAVMVLAIIATVSVTSISPSMALGMDGAEYTDDFVDWAGIEDDPNEKIKGQGFDVWESGEVLPGFGNIGETMTYLMLGFVPVLFVVKFAGRAILNITHSGQGKMDIPNFFKTAKERGQGERGGAYDDSAWYIDMGKDFLRFFGIAVAVWLVFAGIIAVINLVMSQAPNADASGDTIMGQLGG